MRAKYSYFHQFRRSTKARYGGHFDGDGGEGLTTAGATAVIPALGSVATPRFEMTNSTLGNVSECSIWICIYHTVKINCFCQAARIRSAAARPISSPLGSAGGESAAAGTRRVFRPRPGSVVRRSRKVKTMESDLRGGPSHSTEPSRKCEIPSVCVLQSLAKKHQQVNDLLWPVICTFSSSMVSTQNKIKYEICISIFPLPTTNHQICTNTTNLRIFG